MNEIAEATKNNIQYIRVDRLAAHPDNPRRNLGDLTELVESIRERGILQNLTVVPPDGIYDDLNGYVVVIGHRRLAAAILAGLEYVPCIIASMTAHEQISVMLLENIQRNDLTVLEQAHGFQMMMDMGDNYDEIAKATGISAATIRRRVKLLEYDENKVASGLERGARMEDYVRLEEISNAEAKKRLLGVIGTNNFDNEIKKELERQKLRAVKEALADALEVKFSDCEIRVVESNNSMYGDRNYKSIKTFNHNEDEIEVPDDEKHYILSISDYGVSLFCLKTKEELAEEEKYSSNGNKSPEEKAEQEDRERRKKLINEATGRAQRLRADFIREKGVPTAQKNTVIDFAAGEMKKLAIDWSYNAPTYKNIKLVLGEDFSESDADIEELLCDAIEGIQNNYRKLLVLAVAMAEENMETGYGMYGYDLRAKQQPRAKGYYAFLESIGYRVSDEERALIEGTHEGFTTGGEKDE